MPGTRIAIVAAALTLLAGCGGARGPDPAGGEDQAVHDPSLGALDGVDDVFGAPRPIPGNPYIVIASRDRLVKDLAVLDIAPLDVGGPRAVDDGGRMKRLGDREIARRQRRKERVDDEAMELEELCSLSTGSTEEKAIARARKALVRFARKRARRDVVAVVFVDEPYAKEVILKKGRYRAEVCGRMDSRKLRK